MVVDDGVVKTLNVEDAPGKADISGADNLLKSLYGKLSIVILEPRVWPKAGPIAPLTRIEHVHLCPVRRRRPG